MANYTNPNVEKVVRAASSSLAGEQGGTSPEGSGADPARHAESAPDGTGHSSAESAGVSGNLGPS